MGHERGRNVNYRCVGRKNKGIGKRIGYSRWEESNKEGTCPPPPRGGGGLFT